MATKKKMLEAAAGGAGGDTLDITDVFSTYLYTSTNTNLTITNGIDIPEFGGMTWFKPRTSAKYNNNIILDTERADTGSGYPYLITNSTAAQSVAETPFYAGTGYEWQSDGFGLGQTDYANGPVSGSGSGGGVAMASWTFRKAPKFFDVVTYTGDGSSNRQIAHNLGSTPGLILIKRIDSTGNWLAWHKEVNPGYGMLDLTLAFTAGANGFVNAVADTYFETSWLNTSGATYVAYLFAHNDNGDGEFGPNNDQDIIKCGSYTGNGNYTTGNEVDVGFEPQWVMIKNASRTDGNSDWVMYDTMRGFTATNKVQPGLFANLSDAETASGGKSYQSFITTSGFTLMDSNQAINYNGDTYIYMAIRRGPLAPPTAGTEVFAPNFYGTSGYVGYLGAPADMHMLGYRSGNSQNAITSSRMIQDNKALVTSSTAAEITTNSSWDNMLGVSGGVGSTITTLISWTWKRAPSFFDVVAYTGDSPGGIGTQIIKHNLGTPPEMIWFKKRSGTSGWGVLNTHLPLVSGLGQGGYINETSAFAAAGWWGGPYVAPTSTDFLVRGSTPNASGSTYIAYLFATLAGVSKVGSVTHSGTTNVDCGFSAGARFVLLKRTDATGDWYLWDSVRGIIAGNDPYLLLNSTAAGVTNTDYIDPLSSGFTITSTFTAGDYIFYAIA